MQLKELDERLGSLLVERTRSRVMLTPIGEEIARSARIVLAEVEDIREVARRHDPDEVQGTLPLGVVQTAGAYVLSLAMPSLRTAFPHLRVVVREDRMENLPKKLSDGTYEALLLPDDPAQPDFTTARLIRELLHLVVPSDHRLARFETVEPEELAGETVLTMERGHRLHDQIAALCDRVGAEHARDYAGTTLDMLRQMVAVGMGVTLLPALYVRSDVLREKLVVARPLASGAPTRDLTMAWRTSSPRQRTYGALAATIGECLAPWGCPD